MAACRTRSPKETEEGTPSGGHSSSVASSGKVSVRSRSPLRVPLAGPAGEGIAAVEAVPVESIPGEGLPSGEHHESGSFSVEEDQFGGAGRRGGVLPMPPIPRSTTTSFVAAPPPLPKKLLTIDRAAVLAFKRRWDEYLLVVSRLDSVQVPPLRECIELSLLKYICKYELTGEESSDSEGSFDSEEEEETKKGKTSSKAAVAVYSHQTVSDEDLGEYLWGKILGELAEEEEFLSKSEVEKIISSKVKWNLGITESRARVASFLSAFEACLVDNARGKQLPKEKDQIKVLVKLLTPEESPLIIATDASGWGFGAVLRAAITSSSPATT